MYEIYYVLVIKLQTSRAKIFIVSFFEIVFSLGLNYKITVILFCMLFFFKIWLNSFNSESKLSSQITHIYDPK